MMFTGRFSVCLCWLLLTATTALAQSRPGAPARRAEPAPACLVSEFRAMALGTHDLAERGRKATEWLTRNTPACGEAQLRLLSSNRTQWLGNADSMALMGLIDSALEAKVKGDPEKLARMFGAAAPPPRPADDDTMRSGTLAPRPPPVVAPGTPAVVSAPPVVVAPPAAGAVAPPTAGLAPGAAPASTAAPSPPTAPPPAAPSPPTASPAPPAAPSAPRS